ncbi:GNAT family acetyltransferase [Halobacteriales archaeon QH_10_67_22]|nr:MAG: GNAT family acetyltransferase [Halobacteriales archaeon QH_10_67_22]
MDARTGPDDGTLYVATDEAESGSEAPFRIVYRDTDRTRRWGFFCSNCDSFDTAMDSMGRIQCNGCGNLRKPDEWDAAHE